ncbi:MAG: putative immunity protein, partial [Candidatus Caldatribacteriota bacterium]
MRDKSFIAVHRGGLLTKEQHRNLIEWARKCSEHVIPLLGNNIDNRLIAALEIAQEWKENKASV